MAKAKTEVKEAAPTRKGAGIVKHVGAAKVPAQRWATFQATDAVPRRGPKGAPVYDNYGFELDYKKVLQARRPRRRKNHTNYMEMLHKHSEEKKRKCEIMGTTTEKVSAMTLMAWNDRISRDLNIQITK